MLLLLCFVFFFFKQKTAYEMRISDWSSDVCSSDLYGRTLNLEERLSVVAQAAREMIRPTVFGQAIIILVYVPLLTLTGVEGKTFTPMALTVIKIGRAHV